MDFGKMARLRPSIAHMFDDVVTNDHVEHGIRKRLLDARNLPVVIAIDYLPIVHHVHGMYLAAQLWMDRKVVCNATGASAYFQHAQRLPATGQVKQPLDLQRFSVARSQIERDVRQALRS
jgi:hypothetical protein